MSSSFFIICKKKVKIILITSDGLRHKYLASKLNKNKSIKLLKIFIEKNSKTKKSQFNSKVLKSYLYERNYYEKKFFYDYVKYNYNKKLETNLLEEQLNTEEFLSELNKYKPDFIISFGCSVIKGNIIKMYKNKFINIHLGLSPHMRGIGTNIFPIYLNKIELLGATIMFISEKIDGGKIIHHIVPNLSKSENIHEIGFNIVKKTFSMLIKILLSGKVIKAKKLKNINGHYFKRKDFTEQVLKQVKINLNSGIIKKHLKNPKKVKLINFFKK